MGRIRVHRAALRALALILLVIMVVWGALLVRDKILGNVRELGTQLAQSYAAEEAARIDSFELFLTYGATSMDELIDDGADAERMRTWLARFAAGATSALDGFSIDPYAVIDGGIVAANPREVSPGFEYRDSSWYRDALASPGKIYMSDAYEDVGTGEYVVTLSVSLERAGDVLAIDISLSDIEASQNALDLPQDCSYFLFDGEGELLGVSTSIDLGSDLSQEYLDSLRDAILAGTLDDPGATYEGIGGERRSIFFARLDNGWLSVVTMPTSSILRDGWDPAFTGLAVACLGLAIALLAMAAIDRARGVRLGRTKRVLQILGNTFYAIYRVDLSRETYETVKCEPGTARDVGARGSYAHLLDVLGGCVEERTFRTFSESFSIEHARSLRRRGVEQYGGDFRRRFSDGYHWVSIRAIFDASLPADEMILCFRVADEEVREREQSRELLESALEAARQSAKRKSVFFSNISHDMRTPLNAIIGMCRLMRDHLDDREAAERYLRHVEDAGEQLVTLVDDVLDMSHIEHTGQTLLKIAPMDLGACVRRAAELFEGRAVQEGKTLEVSCADSVGWVRGDAARLRQVLNNLISNAMKYSLEGARVDVSVEPVDACGAGARRTRTYRIVVADTGIGMSEDFLPRLFEPYARDEVFAPREVRGTGLGMPIVKNLVEQMDGTVSVASELGVGTEIALTIPFEVAEPPSGDGDAGGGRARPRAEGPALPPAGPRAIEPADAEAAPPREAEGGAGGSVGPARRVLVAEDTEANTIIVCALLDALGVAYECVGDGRAAVERFAEREPGAFGAILMDMQMPVMDGCEAARAIRALDRPDARRVPIIAVTANALTEDAARAREAGMTDRVTKPIDLGSLSAALGRAGL